VLDQREVLLELLALKDTLIFDPHFDLVAHLNPLNRGRRRDGILLLNRDNIVRVVNFTYVEIAETGQGLVLHLVGQLPLLDLIFGHLNLQLMSSTSRGRLGRGIQRLMLLALRDIRLPPINL
jgi:hypothetical protein